jgi:ring-1,2-phenylacetyl-CoA epoxidase subunit PaaD
VTTSAYDVAATVVDPELRVVTIAELGILRGVSEDPATGRVVVTITPTYSGCPAMDVIRADIRRALHAAGHTDVQVRTELSPAWSTDMITESGRARLAAAGVAPPGPAGGSIVLGLPSPRSRLAPAGPVACPRCGSAQTEEISRFGSTACKALWRCRACAEPFEQVKPL